MISGFKNVSMAVAAGFFFLSTSTIAMADNGVPTMPKDDSTWLSRTASTIGDGLSWVLGIEHGPTAVPMTGKERIVSAIGGAALVAAGAGLGAAVILTSPAWLPAAAGIALGAGLITAGVHFFGHSLFGKKDGGYQGGHPGGVGLPGTNGGNGNNTPPSGGNGGGGNGLPTPGGNGNGSGGNGGGGTRVPGPVLTLPGRNTPGTEIPGGTNVARGATTNPAGVSSNGTTRGTGVLGVSR
jgi:hypothetical protein